MMTETVGSVTKSEVVSATPEPIPPGAPEAVRLGCCCPQWLNGYGAGLRADTGSAAEGEYLAHPACRLHGPL